MQQRKSSNVPVNKFQRYSTAILFVVYIFSLFLLIPNIVIYFFYGELTGAHPKTANEVILSYFCIFGSSNGMVVYRLFGINIFTGFIHGILHLLIPAGFIFCMFFNGSDRRGLYVKFPFVMYFVLAVFVLHCILAFHCVVFRPGLSRKQRIRRSGCHAFFGFIVYFLLIFNHFFLLGMLCEDLYPTILTVLSMWYILLILFILLTPFFEYELREKVKQKTRKKKKSTKKQPEPQRRSQKEPMHLFT